MRRSEFVPRSRPPLFGLLSLRLNLLGLHARMMRGVMLPVGIVMLLVLFLVVLLVLLLFELVPVLR